MPSPPDPERPWNVVEFPEGAIRHRHAQTPDPPRLHVAAFVLTLLVASLVVALGMLAQAWWTEHRGASRGAPAPAEATRIEATARPAASR